MKLRLLPDALSGGLKRGTLAGAAFLVEHKLACKIYVVGQLVYDLKVKETRNGYQICGKVAMHSPPDLKVCVDLSQLNLQRWVLAANSCSCVEGEDCKHVAAVIRAALDAAYQPRHDLASKTADAFPKKTPAKSPEAAPLSPFLQGWLLKLEDCALEGEGGEEGNFMPPADTQQRLLYLLSSGEGKTHGTGVELSLQIAKLDAEGDYQPIGPFSLDFKKPPPFLSEGDLDLLDSIRQLRTENGLHPAGPLWGVLLPRIVASGRLVWQSVGNAPLQMMEEPLTVHLGWQTLPNGRQKPILTAPGRELAVFPTQPVYVLDTTDFMLHPLRSEESERFLLGWLALPTLAPEDADALAQHLVNRDTDFSPLPKVPMPARLEAREIADEMPQPRLRLTSDTVFSSFISTVGSFSYDQIVRLGTVEFTYPSTPDHWVPAAAGPHKILCRQGDQVISLTRNRTAERDLEDGLISYGLKRLNQVVTMGLKPSLKEAWAMAPDSPTRWFRFLLESQPRLEAKGWLVEKSAAFNLEIIQPNSYFNDISANPDDNWFSVDCGVEVNGVRISLLPAILAYLRSEGQALNLTELELLGEQPLMLPYERKFVAFPASRLHRILSILSEMYSSSKTLLKDDKLVVHRLRAAQLLPEDGLGFSAKDPRLAVLSTQLQSTADWRHEAVPVGLKATLRPYQLEGYRWLRFLAKFQLGGILADDMGLGKTLQTLAMLLAEKESGSMSGPSLIVAPKSVVFNWAEEAARFAPKLRTMIYSGADRGKRLAQIPQNDLVFTNYPILARDEEALSAFEFHCIILDEAQNIKNASAKVTTAAQRLHSRIRLCLTGTPIENHLGELWSIYNFLMPGFLGSRDFFQHTFRDPIEKDQDNDRRAYLKNRLTPVLLRRTKENVLQDLPPKVETIHRVELTQAQKDLYETVRSAMDDRIRKEISERGAGRSQIQILDALLKLRQICCHPRLLKMDAAQQVQESAKLDALMEVLVPLVEDGRKVLIFSQFTEMLAIISARLEAENLTYLLLTGQTEDRRTLVHQFQAGAAPIFLISLKAGGVGLNLTAADTVIHYDPWWNPAAENQATDRAHRMGQKNTVFVFKFICQDTIEEKILLLQRSKSALVQGLLDGESPSTDGKLHITEADLAILFQPLPK